MRRAAGFGRSCATRQPLRWTFTHPARMAMRKVTPSIPSAAAAPASGPHAPPVSHDGPADTVRYTGCGRFSPLTGVWKTASCTKLYAKCAIHAAHSES
jgi:hypothetical protein